ncbi:MAG: hypothetical protein ACE366_20625 [Bradymonadia bacterium]
MQRWLSFAVVVQLSLSGCGWLIGAQDGRECEADDDCFTGWTCQVDRGRCARSQPGTEGHLGGQGGSGGGQGGAGAVDQDSGLSDAGFDAELGDEIDAELDASIPDDGVLPDLGTINQLVPTTPGPLPFPEGRCFADERGVIPTRSAIDPPRGWCSTGGAVWLDVQDSGAMALQIVNTPEGDPIEGPQIDANAELVIDDATVLYEDLLGDQPRIMRLDVLDPESGPSPLEESLRAQSQPTQWQGISGFVEAGNAGESRVILLDETGFRLDCSEGRSGIIQWSPLVTPDRVGWFERSVPSPGRSQRVELVLTTGLACGRRIAFSIDDPGPDARLQSSGDRWFWLADGPDGRKVLWRLDFFDRLEGPRLQEAVQQDVPAPVEFAVHGDHLAVVGYSPSGYRMNLYDLLSNTRGPLGAPLNVRRPSLSARFVLWAGQGGTADWEIRYEALE